LKITILYDAIEDKFKAEADEKPFPLVYEAVSEALRERGHEVRLLAAQPEIRELIAQLEQDDGDLIFNLCESLVGVSQREQNVAALLELLGKRFTGAGSLGLALAQDKALTKKLLGFHGIRYPKFSVIDSGQVDWADDLDFPLFVKPLNQDASIGIDDKSIVNNVKELMERISFIHTEFGAPALIEEFIEGREIYAVVLGGDSPTALPIIEWDFSKVPGDGPNIASSEAKWDEGSPYNQAPLVFPTDIPEPVYQKIQETAVAAFTSLKLRDYGRIDLRLRPRAPGSGDSAAPAQPQQDKATDWEFYVIEVNPNPHLATDAEVALAAQTQGLEYPALLERIVELAMTRGRQAC
jgi:D-alanine-D-alanine ligase